MSKERLCSVYVDSATTGQRSKVSQLWPKSSVTFKFTMYYTQQLLVILLIPNNCYSKAILQRSTGLQLDVHIDLPVYAAGL